MTTIRLLAAVLTLLASLPAAIPPQESVRDVVPGRDFEEHKLLTPGQTDVWKLDVEQDEMLWCVVESGGFDPVLDLVDADGVVLGSDDGLGTRSELWLRMPKKGAVQFRVRPFQGSGGGHYRYHLHRFGTGPLGAAAEASHTFGREQWWHYRVALREGDVLVPTVLGEGRLGAVLDAMRNGVAAVCGGYRAPHTGDYFVRIEGAEGKRCQTLTQLARCSELRADTVQDEKVAGYGLDHWRIVVRGGEAFVLDLQMPGVQLANELVDVVASREGPAFVGTGHFDKGGQLRRLFVARRDTTLELRLRNTASAPVSYRAVVRRPERDLAVGTTVPGHLDVGDGVLYRLQLTSGQLLRVLLESSAFDGKFDLWDTAGNVFATVDDRGPLDRNPSHTFLVPATGTYRVLAYCSGGGGGGDFTLATEALVVPQLQPGVPMTVRVAAGAPTYLHLDLHAGQVVWLSVQSPAFDAGLTVLDPAGNGSFCCEGGGIGSDVLVAYRASHDGRHTLLVHSRNGAGEGEVKVVPQ